jgi:hypothetical protein
MLDIEKYLDKARPRSIVYLFSGGKDSSLALLLTRDSVRKWAESNGAKVYIVFININGNTHPANTYCSSSVMLWHRSHYGFTPVWLSSEKVFQEYVERYGLMRGPNRWCYTEFKAKPLRRFYQGIVKPVLFIDGMSASDSKERNIKLKDTLHMVRGFVGEYWSLHPLNEIPLDREQKLEILRRHREFMCVVELYEKYGDSLNCVLCPYKRYMDYVRLRSVDDVLVYNAALFLHMATRGEYHRLASRLLSRPLF